MDRPVNAVFAKGSRAHSLLLCSAFCTLVPAATAQVFTVSTEHVDGRALVFKPTDVPLPTAKATERTRQDLIRSLGSEQGFAMRPLPITSKGVTLEANGELSPSGSAYVEALEEHGIAAKPGDRVVITEIKIKNNRIVLDLNGGPDHKHKILRHISVGGGGGMTSLAPPDGGAEPTGARLTLVFPHELPDVTGAQVEALLAPVIGFGKRSSTEAYVDGLPPLLKKAILAHHVLVGMSSDMVLHAVGQPQQKVREQQGQMPFEEWIYGKAPEPVEFVRLNNERVIRIEDARVGETPVVRAANEVGDYWSTHGDGTMRTVKLGDETPTDRAQQNQTAAAPTLRRPGETLPTDKEPQHPTPQAVQFPKGMEKPYSLPPAPPAAAQPGPPPGPPSGSPSGSPSEQPAPSSPSGQGPTAGAPPNPAPTL